MPHHGHFVQSRLPVEDNNISVTHVPFHLSGEVQTSLSKGAVQGREGPWTRNALWVETDNTSVLMSQGTRISLPLWARRQAVGNESVMRCLREHSARKSPETLDTNLLFCASPGSPSPTTDTPRAAPGFTRLAPWVPAAGNSAPVGNCGLTASPRTWILTNRTASGAPPARAPPAQGHRPWPSRAL